MFHERREHICLADTGRQLGAKDGNKTLSEKDFINNVIDGELEDNKKP